MEKKCFKCNKILPIDCFYRHYQMADGHFNKCKSCAKKDSIDRYYDKHDEVRAYDKERYQRPDRKKYVANLNRIHKLNHPQRNKARYDMSNAIRDGRLVRGACEKCGTRQHVEGHHKDYNKPLEVNWLCRECHGKEHRKVNL